MPRPQFITCQLCGKGFGSASINIHIPQCYEKALKRWKIDPMGPRPVMPALHGNAGGVRKGAGGGRGGGGAVTSSTLGFDEQPCGGGVAAVRSLHSHGTPSPQEGEAVNLNLHPCAKCGRRFNFDRIAYHESVCKGDQKRKVFDSSKQRRASGEEDDDGYGGGFGRPSGGRGAKGKKRGLGVATTASRYTPAPAPKTNWRQQHEEFINAIRSAKQSEAAAQSMWGGTAGGVAVPSRTPAAPSRGPQQPPFQRSSNAGGGGGGSKTAMARGMPPPSQRVPPLMTKQSDTFKQNVASGGRAARAKAGAPVAPPPRGGAGRPGNRVTPPQRSSFGGQGDRFGGRSYGGGGGGGRIMNDNTSSIGMLQALGQA